MSVIKAAVISITNKSMLSHFLLLLAVIMIIKLYIIKFNEDYPNVHYKLVDVIQIDFEMTYKM